MNTILLKDGTREIVDGTLDYIDVVDRFAGEAFADALLDHIHDCTADAIDAAEEEAHRKIEIVEDGYCSILRNIKDEVDALCAQLGKQRINRKNIQKSVKCIMDEIDNVL